MDEQELKATVRDAVFKMADTIPQKIFCECFGYTKTKVRSKIRRKEWAEGEQFFKDPDGQIHISLRGYKAWVKGCQQALELETEKSRSGLLKKARNDARIKPLTPPSIQIPRLE